MAAHALGDDRRRDQACGRGRGGSAGGPRCGRHRRRPPVLPAHLQREGTVLVWCEIARKQPRQRHS